jgi:hypothetical protein
VIPVMSAFFTAESFFDAARINVLSRMVRIGP